MHIYLMYFFFFQAEDGIRDYKVTGVQTCALPISWGADIVLKRHDHNYERFAPQRADGTGDAAFGIREFVVGTGGASHDGFGGRKSGGEGKRVDLGGRRII